MGNPRIIINPPSSSIHALHHGSIIIVIHCVIASAYMTSAGKHRHQAQAHQAEMASESQTKITRPHHITSPRIHPHPTPLLPLNTSLMILLASVMSSKDVTEDVDRDFPPLPVPLSSQLAASRARTTGLIKGWK
jgi:hypothetical protein